MLCQCVLYTYKNTAFYSGIFDVRIHFINFMDYTNFLLIYIILYFVPFTPVFPGCQII